MHGPWHPILHNAPRLPKIRAESIKDPETVPIIANDYSWYRPLDTARKEIRILFLEPEPLDSPKDVVVHVFNASLLDPNVPKLYGCLSYCWGDSSITKAIQVMYTEKPESASNSLVTTKTEFHVTANLEAALRVFRSKLKRPVMWADALCIDQSDVAERSSQVALMGQIYMQAVQTIVWLGNADATTKSVFDFADFLTTMEVKSHEVDPNTIVAGIKCHRLRPLAKGELQFTDMETSSDDFYKLRWGIQAILSRPFFRRAWVLQEVGLADREQIVVHCGEHSLWWQTLQNLTSFEWRAAAHQGPLLISHERDRRLDLPELPFAHSGIHHTLPEIWSYLRRYCSNTKRGNITDLIFRRLEIQATDPRDQLIALFGLAEECQLHDELHPGFRADYSRDVAESYTLFTRAVIDKLQDLVVLSAKNVFAASTSDPRSLPTWVPDFSSHMDLRRTLGYLGIGQYRAAGKTKPTITIQDSRVLSLAGFIIDKISSELDWGPFHMEVRTKNINKITDPSILMIDGQRDSIQKLWRMVTSRIINNPVPNQELIETFILTLIGSRRTYFDRALITTVTQIQELFADFAAYWKHTCSDLSSLPMQTAFYDSPRGLLDLATKGHAGRFGQRLYYTCHERAFLVTERGLLALVPPETKNGDLVVICEGGNVPFVVRKISDSRMQFVGECYVHGVMRGSTMIEVERGLRERRILHFV